MDTIKETISCPSCSSRIMRKNRKVMLKHCLKCAKLCCIYCLMDGICLDDWVNREGYRELKIYNAPSKDNFEVTV